MNDDKVAVDYLAAQVLRNQRRGINNEEHFTAEKAKSFVARLKREATAHREPKKMNDVADPYVTIRKLIQLVESLQAELKTDPSDELLKEMELLRVENGNLYIVQGECQELRKKAVRRRRLASENRELKGSD